MGPGRHWGLSPRDPDRGGRRGPRERGRLKRERARLGRRGHPNADPFSPPGQAPWVVEGSRPPTGWPLKGEVEFRNYSVRYRPGLELVLKNLSLRVRGGEKVHEGRGCAWHVVGTYGRRAGVMPP